MSVSSSSSHPKRELRRLAEEVLTELGQGPIEVDGTPVAPMPSVEVLSEVILPMLLWCRETAPTGERGLVGIVGPPGSGKSTLCAWFEAAASSLHFEDCAFMSLDGYHFANAVLDARTGMDPKGNVVSMRALKGTPASFDAEALLKDLRALQTTHHAHRVPAYSRALHEPVPDAVQIGPEARWVFVEGNFLFLDEPPWRETRELLDRRLYVHVPEAILRSRLAGRHARAGRSQEWIDAHYRRTDGPNIRRVEATRPYADVVIEWPQDRNPAAR